MQTAPSSAPALPAPPAVRRWARWFAPRPPQAVSAVMLGERCLLARVERGGQGGGESGRLQLSVVAEGDVGELRAWKAQGHFERAQSVLVLRHQERHLLTANRPEVPDAELGLAMRFPLAEAMEAEPEQILCTALALPRINEAMRAQVLAVGGRVAPTLAHLEHLKSAGIKVRCIDTIDSALRGMTLLQGTGNDGVIALAFIGHDICIGLLWRGEFCALRTLALPVRAPLVDGEFEEQLALHIQRTTDHFERQATALAVRHVLASMPALAAPARESLRAALPMGAQLFELDTWMSMSGVTREHIDGHNDLTALACVAAARLLDMRTVDGHAPAVQPRQEQTA